MIVVKFPEQKLREQFMQVSSNQHSRNSKSNKGKNELNTTDEKIWTLKNKKQNKKRTEAFSGDEIKIREYKN